MGIWFPPPSAPPAAVVQQECGIVYHKVVHLASQRVIEAHDKNVAKAKNLNGGTGGFTNQRHSAIRDMAFGIGAQAGLAWRYRRIDALLKNPALSSLMDRTFDFGVVMTGQHVLYPVISQARRSFILSSDGQTARSSRVTWRIIDPARIVSIPPNWRSYLYQSVSAKLHAPQGLMPYDSSEERMWRSGICQGFAAGSIQADNIFQDRMSRLVRDYVGMLRYRVLEAEGVVTRPKVVSGNYGVQIAPGGQQVYVGSSIIRITNPSRFDQEKDWRAVLSPALHFNGQGGHQ